MVAKITINGQVLQPDTQILDLVQTMDDGNESNICQSLGLVSLVQDCEPAEFLSQVITTMRNRASFPRSFLTCSLSC